MSSSLRHNVLQLQKFFSIVLQAVADANYKFITIDVGGYGKQSDGDTFRSSSLFYLMENDQLNIPSGAVLPNSEIVAPYVFIGDEAHPLLKHLMKPYSRRNVDVDNEYFNLRLSRARRVIECAFGIISAKFRILLKPIESSPDLADSIIKCICVLHNIINNMEGINIDNVEKESSIQCEDMCVTRDNNRSTDVASFVRETYKLFICRNKI